MRDRTPLPPFTYRYAIMSIAAVLTLVLVGCTSGVPITTAWIPTQQRMEAADTAASEAVDAFNKGQQSQGDAALTCAVVLLTETTDGAFSDEGFIEVAKRIAAKSRPQDAVRLLEPLTKDANVAKDPLLWGTLSHVVSLAGGNSPRAEAAAKEAEKRAQAVLQQAGGPAPKAADLVSLESLFLHTGRYYDECVKDYPKALQAYREARRLLPKDPITANMLGYELADRGTTPGDFAEALQLTDQARQAVPDSPEILDSYGWALFKRDDKKQSDLLAARRVLREAVDLAPSIPECRYHLAAVYEKYDLITDAYLEAQRAIALRPDYPEAKALMDRLKPRIAVSPSPSPSPSASPTPATMKK